MFSLGEVKRVVVAVERWGVNDAPVAASDVYRAAVNTALVVPAPGVLANDVDIDSMALTAILDSPPLSGTLQLEVNGAFTYWPDPGFTGQDAFTYRAYDGWLESSPVRVEIWVQDDQPQSRFYLPLVLGGQRRPDGISVGE